MEKITGVQKICNKSSYQYDSPVFILSAKTDLAILKVRKSFTVLYVLHNLTFAKYFAHLWFTLCVKIEKNTILKKKSSKGFQKNGL